MQENGKLRFMVCICGETTLNTSAITLLLINYFFFIVNLNHSTPN